VAVGVSRNADWFGTVTGDVAFDPSLSTTAKAAYLVLVMHRNRDTNECYPSNKTIAQAVGCSERTAIRALNELADAGVIERTPQFRDGRQVQSLTRLTDARAERHGRRGVTDDTHGGVTGGTQNTPSSNTIWS
jgi:DNA-binding transcriptional MocR family regulator